MYPMSDLLNILSGENNNSMPNLHITVACILYQDDKFLFVRERDEGKIVYNQPAGHVERGETLLEAAKRETLEETGWEVEISGFLGIYHYTAEKSGICYVRHSFIGKNLFRKEDYKLDEDIIDTCWMSLNEAEKLSKQMRSPLVLKTLYDFNQRNHYPISLISSECRNNTSRDS